MTRQVGSIGAVVIGRNEGKRLIRCLESCVNKAISTIVYVDSGSSDQSVEEALSRGVTVIHLDNSVPFTAARARNAGYRALENGPEGETLSFIQFIDGDCELIDGWTTAAVDAFADRPDFALVTGRLRERFPESSVYNRMCDDEWNLPAGETRSSGGIFMVRKEAFAGIGGFREELIAGEEPELCVRLRRKGWRLLRLDRDMAWHDAAITFFSQWWKRSVRSGHAYAEGFALHGQSSQRHWVKENIRLALWGFLAPLIILLLSFFHTALLALFLIYPLRILRLFRRYGKTKYAIQRAAFDVFVSIPQAIGAFSYLWARLCGKRRRLIEHKGVEST